MHIPDGLMDPIVWAVGLVLAVFALIIAFKRLNKKIDDERIPLMAVLAAGIFVAQMLNFPVFGGTTGHVIGAALAVILLGPIAAMAVLTVVVIVQALFFGDGGLTALGLNLFNMAVIAPLVAWVAFKFISRKDEKVGIFSAAWLSVFLSALAVAAELSISYWLSSGAYGVTPLVSFPVMLGFHTLIGIGEGIITLGIWAFITQVAPEMTNLRKMIIKETIE